MTTSITIHREVPSQNKRERWHWAVQRKEVTTWAQFFAFHKSKLGLQNACGPRKLVITAYRKQRIQDYANLVGGCKGLLDGMVRAKLLVDDNMEMVTVEYKQELASKSPTKKPLTVIEIVE